MAVDWVQGYQIVDEEGSVQKRCEGLAGIFHLLYAEKGAFLVDRVVNVWEVLEGGALSHAAESVVDGAMTDAHPAVVGAQIGDRDTTQMGTYGRTHQHLRIACG